MRSAGHRRRKACRACSGLGGHQVPRHDHKVRRVRSHEVLQPRCRLGLADHLHAEVLLHEDAQGAAHCRFCVGKGCSHPQTPFL